MLASQPGAVTEGSLVKAKVRQPVGWVETNAVPGAICVPHHPPVPYTLLPEGTPLVLANCGEAMLGPS